MVKEIDANNYQELVLDAKGPVVVDFYSTECPPCEALAPKLHFYDDLYKDEITVYKIFRQGNKELSLDLNVKGSPTLLFYKDGKEVSERLSGAVTKQSLKETLIKAYGLEDKSVNIEREKIDADVAIIGGGPAGLTAAIYASRAKLKTVLIDKGNTGGYVNVTHQVANYPGTGPKPIQGFMLMHHMTEQAKATDTQIIMAADITNLDLKDKVIEIDDDKVVNAKTIILATGSKPRPLNIPGEKELGGKGVSYCATCDGAFYEGKPVYVIGGGNSAVEEASFLTKYASKVTMIHQFDEFQANKMAAEELLNNPKVDVLWSHEPRAFLGDNSFEKLEVEDLKTGEKKILDQADGVFVFVGYVAQTELFSDQIELDQWGCVKTDEDMQTNIQGVYCVGDVRAKKYRQITTAVSDGTIAALTAEKYIHKLKKGSDIAAF